MTEWIIRSPNLWNKLRSRTEIEYTFGIDERVVDYKMNVNEQRWTFLDIR